MCNRITNTKSSIILFQIKDTLIAILPSLQSRFSLTGADTKAGSPGEN